MQCIHNGFGLHKLGKELTGPEYYIRFVNQANELGVEYMLDSMVLQVNHETNEVLCTSSKSGLTKVKAGSIVLAMGCREKTRASIMVPGTRPAGLYTAGAAQRLVNRQNIMVGKKTKGGRFATIGASDAVFVIGDEVLNRLSADIIEK